MSKPPFAWLQDSHKHTIVNDTSQQVYRVCAPYDIRDLLAPIASSRYAERCRILWRRSGRLSHADDTMLTLISDLAMSYSSASTCMAGVEIPRNAVMRECPSLCRSPSCVSDRLASLEQLGAVHYYRGSNSPMGPKWLPVVIIQPPGDESDTYDTTWNALHRMRLSWDGESYLSATTAS